ncbi:alkaline phosphatase PhoX [Nodularia harveyana UHCC-0300]|uniref:Alkaline phosphatase PhoX n=1 Tax=Nodularia harveyana UHCC-0300 TaxID=2974287 RepID=A0ABU5UIB7_9CYAN|nr:alkaline phosphatase PhoX [Nodularia harveyana]MEA5583312.1 alkaline phosphatase PhoX [Nodularia harveyana UHCC-0300]
MTNNTQFDTTQPAQIKGLEGYTVDPIFTIGETVNGYTPTGIPDGTGAFELNETTVRVLVNSEIGSDVGYAYTLENGTSLTGSRISYFDIDKRTLKIVDSGLAYNKIYNRAGEIVDEASDLEFEGIQRFCSANLMEAQQFGGGRGFADTIYFAGEETSGGTQFALDVETSELWALPWLGRAAWESVTELDTGNTDQVALLVGDDRGAAPLILYVGEKDTSAGAGFLARNGLNNGKLYVWVADDASDAADAIEADPRDFSGSGNTTAGQFVEIDYYRPDLAGTDGYDTQGFADQDQQDALAADAGAFLFSRPEDVATNPFDGTQAVLASTGRTSVFDGADTWGTTYKIDVDFDDSGITADLNILYDGNDEGNRDFGLRSPDNLDWADNGKIYLQEDRAISSDLFGASSGEEASIWRIDPSDANPAATATRVAQIDRSGVPAGQTDPNPTDIGNWESSGILDVSTLFGNAPGTQFIYDVQAHSLRDGDIINKPGIDTDGDGTVEANDNLVQGGQIGFLIAPDANLIQDSQLVSGSTGADVLVAGSDFDGINDTVFTGAGNDEVDVYFGGVLAGNNRISTGSGEDTIYVGNRDRAFGGSGSDVLDATDATGYRISGGAGDDIFFLGADGRAVGGAGDDIFFVQEGGGNLLSGGAGADQFWIITGDLPMAANTIVDFEMGTDVLGIAGQGADFGFDNLTLTGDSIMIGATSVAMLNTTGLTAANFAFI